MLFSLGQLLFHLRSYHKIFFWTHNHYLKSDTCEQRSLHANTWNRTFMEHSSIFTTPAYCKAGDVGGTISFLKLWMISRHQFGSSEVSSIWYRAAPKVFFAASPQLTASANILNISISIQDHVDTANVRDRCYIHRPKSFGVPSSLYLNHFFVPFQITLSPNKSLSA